ncbi:hypothetical protein BVY04_05410 [bacterium M21]|nr:hypothetical protein BVY04_05410 [bacterium M21]
MNRKFGVSLFGILAVYVVIYILISLGGKHKPAATRSLGFPTKYVWQPAGTTLEFRKSTFGGDPELHANALGYAFLPLIWMDRIAWHRDKNFLEGIGGDIKDGADKAFEE